MKIKINPFNPDSIDAAIAQLDGYQQDLDHKCQMLVELLTSLGVTFAQEKVPVRTGTAMGSIFAYFDEDNHRGLIVAGGYCKFIEFGTGVMGLASPHPSQEYIAILNWAYNTGSTIFTTRDGRTGWYYPKDDGTWGFTQGLPSRPFMFETAQMLKEQTEELAKEVFANGGR